MAQHLENHRDHDDGFVVVVLLMSLIPMLLVVGAFSVAMTGKSNELRVELDEERALLAAESGVDEAVYRGQTGALAEGTVVQVLGSSSGFRTVATDLEKDGKDNDGDTVVDEPDENVFQVIVTGTYRNTQRRLAAYLGPVPTLPSITTAFGTMNPNPTIILQGTPEISGTNYQMSGALAVSPPAVPEVTGLSGPPGSSANLLAELTGSEPSKVTGLGGAPSVGEMGLINVPNLVTELSNIANIVLTSNSYSSYNFGDGPGGIFNITYRNGDVRFQGNSQGAGILVVTGDLEMKGTFLFHGVIVVLGDVQNTAGTADVYGAILQGPTGSTIELKGTMQVRYSSEAIGYAQALGGRYAAFNGWQELSR